MEVNKDAVLDSNGIVNMFDNLDVSIGVIDKNMTMIYLNKKGEWFYNHVFGATDLLGKNVEYCHEPKHIERIRVLMNDFEFNKRPLNFFGVPIDIIEGGFLKVVHFPYYRDGEFVGIMEIPIESSLESGGRGEYKMH